jgi:hypothetical protein
MASVIRYSKIPSGVISSSLQCGGHVSDGAGEDVESAGGFNGDLKFTLLVGLTAASGFNFEFQVPAAGEDAFEVGRAGESEGDDAGGVEGEPDAGIAAPE